MAYRFYEFHNFYVINPQTAIMKKGLILFLSLVALASFYSCSKDRLLGCPIASETDTSINGLSNGSSYSTTYQYDNKGRLINVNNAGSPIYTYGNGFVTCPNGYDMGPPDTIYLNAEGYPYQAGGITYIYDNDGHLIKEWDGSGVYMLFTWQNGDMVASTSYYANGTKAGGETVYTYYDNLLFQLTKPNFFYLGANSKHMLQSEKDISNFADTLLNLSYTYYFDNYGRVTGYETYDILPGPSSQTHTGTWVTHLRYNCAD